MLEATDAREQDRPRTARVKRSNPLLADVSEAASSARASDSDSSSDSPKADASATASPVHGAVCTIGMCPICTLVSAFGDVRPELTEHLMLAGREILLALKVLIDARLEGDASSPPPAPAGGLEHISID